jgi:hypothetical protein
LHFRQISPHFALVLAQSIGPWTVADLTDLVKVAGAVSVAIAAVGSTVLTVRRRIPHLTAIPQDPFVTAALLGGAERVVQSAITSLAKSGTLLLGGPEGTQMTISGPFPETGTAVERAVYDQLSTHPSVRVIELLQACQGLRIIQDVAWGQPEIPSEIRIPSLWLLPLRLSTIANISRLGFEFHRYLAFNEAFPFKKTLVFNVFLLIAYWSLSRAQNPRRELLKRLQEAHPDKGSTLESKPPAEWARAVAIHGPYALSGTALSDYVVQFGYVA